jgi:Fe-S-cluster containining protein
MDEPSHHRGTLDHGAEEIEFYYPAGLSWECTRCGRCCMDVEGWDRRVLLLEKDMTQLEEAGEQGFHEHKAQEKFVAVMKKEDGRCVFLGEKGCMVYGDRPLLCRMYPFYVERQGGVYVIGVDTECPGVGGGETLTEEFFRELLGYALDQMEG